MEITAGSQTPAPSLGLAKVKAAPVAELWDLNALNNQPEIHHNAAHLTEFSELNTQPRRRIWAFLRIFFLTLLFSVAAYAAYLVWFEERDPIEEFANHWQNLKSFWADGVNQPTSTPADVPEQRQRLTATVSEPEVVTNREKIEGNPYWHLPNRIDGSLPPLGRLWTLEEEELLRAGMMHRFSYQRWRTVQDIRDKRLRGSEAVLWSAIQDKKFWTRAYAAIALSEMSIPVSLPTLDGVLQDTRSELVAGFFERFTKRCNPAQCYVLRAALRLMDATGRLVALRGIANSQDRYRQLYLAAATLDPDVKIQKWIKSYLSERPLDPDHYNQLLRGIKSGVIDEQWLKETPASLNKSKLKTSPQRRSSGTSGTSEQELKEETDQLDDEVEIFEPETAMCHNEGGVPV